MRHRWLHPFKGLGVHECARCGTTRQVIAIVGIKYHRELKTYVRPDGIRFTGCAPACEPAMKVISRPILAIGTAWLAKHGALLNSMHKPKGTQVGDGMNKLESSKLEIGMQVVDGGNDRGTVVKVTYTAVYIRWKSGHEAWINHRNMRDIKLVK